MTSLDLPAIAVAASQLCQSNPRASAPSAATSVLLYVFTGSRFSTRVHWPRASAASSAITAAAVAPASPGVDDRRSSAARYVA